LFSEGFFIICCKCAVKKETLKTKNILSKVDKKLGILEREKKLNYKNRLVTIYSSLKNSCKVTPK
jgi:hypothetical protein